MLPFTFNCWMVWGDPLCWKSFTEHADQISSVSIETANLSRSGQLRRPGGFNPDQLKSLVKQAHDHKVAIYGLVANAGFDPSGVELLIAQPEPRLKHAAEIAEMAKKDGIDGVDLDYESLKAADRDNFSAFVKNLADECHKRKLKLVIALQAKTSEPGTWDGNIAEDYVAIGKAVDYARVMTYDEHWSTGDPGAIASRSWVEQVLRFALTVIPPKKLDGGLPSYGLDWNTATKKEAGEVTFASFTELAKTNVAQRDETGELHLTYPDHQVWYEDAVAARWKRDLAQKLGCHGLAMWRLGSEDPGLWEFLPKRH
jgi:spore germination protein YaaH